MYEVSLFYEVSHYVTRYAKTNLNFLGFRIIFVRSIINAHLKWISCFLTELRLLFMPFSE